MNLPPLTLAVLLRRYNRFLADVRFDDGATAVAHVPNTGSMRTTRAAGSRVALSHHPSPHRKLEWTLELVQAPGGAWVGVNTMIPNRLVEEAVAAGRISALRGYKVIRREVVCGAGSRIDLMLTSGRRPDCYIEVKNVTYKEGRVALFPDAVTERGTRHLRALARLVAEGNRGVIFFLVNRSDCTAMGPARHIDPVYAETLREVVSQGVEAMAYRARATPGEITIERKVPIRNCVTD